MSFLNIAIPEWVKILYPFRSHTEAKAILKLIQLGALERKQNKIRPHYSKNFRILENQFNHPTSDTEQKNILLSPQQSLMINQISQQDPRKILRGERGIFAREKIPPNTILGFYPGELTLEENLDSDNRFIFTGPETLEKIYVQPKINSKGELKNSDFFAPLINAYSTHGVFKTGKKINQPNCAYHWYYPKHSIFPVLTVVSTRMIPGGQEVLSDYGEDYWQVIKTLLKKRTAKI